MTRAVFRPTWFPLALALVLCSCSNGSDQSGCSAPGVAQYPTPQMVAPQNGATGVPSSLNHIVVSTTTATMVGQLNLNEPTGAVNIFPQLISQAGPPYMWSAPIPPLAP